MGDFSLIFLLSLGDMEERFYRHLWQEEENFLKCLRCGKCLSVCALYQRDKRESLSPRGKTAILEALRDGDLAMDSTLAEIMQHCLHCMRCRVECPAGVDFPRLIFSARAELAASGRLGAVKSFILRMLLKRGRLLPPFTETSARLLSLLDIIIPKTSRWRSLLPLPQRNGYRLFPRPQPRSFLADYAGLHPTPQERRGRVFFFVGCATNLVYTETGRALVKLYNRNGYDVLVAGEQGCCGFPALGYGDIATARYRAKRLAKELGRSDCDALVVACASCGHMLKEEYPRLGIKLSLPVYDAVEYLSKIGGREFNKLAEFPRTVFHLPCHLGRGQGLEHLHQQALEQRLGGNFLGAVLPEECCGAGGTYHLAHYQMTRDMGEAKVRAMQELGGRLMVTSCPGCMLYLDEALDKAGEKRSKHILEVLADDAE
jgi:glycolate oxidase iron-sulfur subunit